MVESVVDDMGLSDDKRDLMITRLIPGFYLQKAFQKEKDQDRKEIIRQKSQELLSVLQNRSGPLSESDFSEIDRMARMARQCAVNEN